MILEIAKLAIFLNITYVSAYVPIVNRVVSRSFYITAPNSGSLFHDNVEPKKIFPHIIITPINIPKRDNQNFINDISNDNLSRNEHVYNMGVNRNKEMYENDDESGINDYTYEKKDEAPEKEVKKERRKSILSRVHSGLSNLFSGTNLIKMLIVLLVMFLSVGLGYQIRKSEENANYVRLPNAQ